MATTDEHWIGDGTRGMSGDCRGTRVTSRRKRRHGLCGLGRLMSRESLLTSDEGSYGYSWCGILAPASGQATYKRAARSDDGRHGAGAGATYPGLTFHGSGKQSLLTADRRVAPRSTAPGGDGLLRPATSSPLCAATVSPRPYSSAVLFIWRGQRPVGSTTAASGSRQPAAAERRHGPRCP